MKLIEKEKSAPFFVNSTINQTNSTYLICYNDEKIFKIKTAFIDLLLSSIIPFLVMLSTSVVIIVILFRIKNKIKFNKIKNNNIWKNVRKCKK